MAAICGFVDPLIAFPDSDVAVKVSCSKPTYTSRLVRLGPGYDNPRLPRAQHTPIPNESDQERDGRLQGRKQLGSYAQIPHWHDHIPEYTDFNAFEVSLWTLPAVPQNSGHRQYLWSFLNHETDASGLALFLDSDGSVNLEYGKPSGGLVVLKSGLVLEQSLWYGIRLNAVFGESMANATVTVAETDSDNQPRIFQESVYSNVEIMRDGTPFVIAGDTPRKGGEDIGGTNAASYNGKIDSFCIRCCRNARWEELARYDFSIGANTDIITDVSSNKVHGALINAPTRAVTDHEWDGTCFDSAKASRGFGAIDFRDDDLDNASWETDFVVPIPPNLLPGIYAVLLEDGHSRNYAPFLVRPGADMPIPKARVANFLRELVDGRQRTEVYPADDPPGAGHWMDGVHGRILPRL